MQVQVDTEHVTSDTPHMIHPRIRTILLILQIVETHRSSISTNQYLHLDMDMPTTILDILDAITQISSSVDKHGHHATLSIVHKDLTITLDGSLPMTLCHHLSLQMDSEHVSNGKEKSSHLLTGEMVRVPTDTDSQHVENGKRPWTMHVWTIPLSLHYSISLATVDIVDTRTRTPMSASRTVQILRQATGPVLWATTVDTIQQLWELDQSIRDIVSMVHTILRVTQDIIGNTLILVSSSSLELRQILQMWDVSESSIIYRQSKISPNFWRDFYFLEYCRILIGRTYFIFFSSCTYETSLRHSYFYCSMWSIF